MSQRQESGIPWWVAFVVAVAIALLLPLVRNILPKASETPRIARRGEPLIRAIEQYRLVNHSVPRSFDEMVPRYMDYVPHPGMRIDRPFVIRRPEVEADRMWTRGCPYAITVDMAPVGTLVYRPSNEYGDLRSRAPEGKPIGRWYLGNID